MTNNKIGDNFNNNQAVNVPEVERLAKSVINPKNTSELNNVLTKYVSDDYFKVDPKLDRAITYAYGAEKILYNPNHSMWSYYNQIEAVTHEINHLIDFEYGISIELSSEIYESVEKAKLIIIRDRKHYERLLDGELGENMSVSDLMSAITENELYGDYYHKKEYWEVIGNREREIVANLMTLYYTNHTAGLNFINEIEPLRKLFEAVKAEYVQRVGA